MIEPTLATCKASTLPLDHCYGPQLFRQFFPLPFCCDVQWPDPLGCGTGDLSRKRHWKNTWACRVVLGIELVTHQSLLLSYSVAPQNNCNALLLVFLTSCHHSSSNKVRIKKEPLHWEYIRTAKRGLINTYSSTVNLTQEDSVLKLKGVFLGPPKRHSKGP